MPLRLATTALLALGLVACAAEPAPEPETQVDSSRIVTLAGDLTELVYELGAGGRVVGIDVTTVGPPSALDLPIVGLGRFITVEGVLDVDPTLVLGDDQTGPLEVLEQIEDSGVAVELFDTPGSFEESYERIEDLGAMLGLQDSAADLVARIRSDFDAIEPNPAIEGTRVAFIYTRGPDVNLLLGQGQVTQPLIEAAGAIDAGTDSGIEGSVSVTAEALVAAAPDVIIVPEEGLEALGGIEGLLELPGVAQTPAARERAILAYPEGDILVFGPRIVETLSRLIVDLGELAE